MAGSVCWMDMAVPYGDDHCTKCVCADPCLMRHGCGVRGMTFRAISAGIRRACIYNAR